MVQLFHFTITMLVFFLYIAETNASMFYLPVVVFDSLCLLTLVASTLQRCDVCTLSVTSLSFSSHISRKTPEIHA